jgi:hypothetical protein
VAVGSTCVYLIECLDIVMVALELTDQRWSGMYGFYLCNYVSKLVFCRSLYTFHKAMTCFRQYIWPGYF